MMKIVLNYIPIKCGIVDSHINRFLYYPGKAMVIPPYDVEVISCGIVSSLSAVQ